MRGNVVDVWLVWGACICVHTVIIVQTVLLVHIPKPHIHVPHTHVHTQTTHTHITQGLGPKCAPLHQMTATAWRHVIQQGLHKHEEYTAAAREMADKLREEHGVAQVVAFLAAGV